MAVSLTDDQVRRLRLHVQRLDPHWLEADADVAQVVREASGIQAQDLPAAMLGVRARSSGLTAADVERARVEERAVVRAWCMRGTLHLVPAPDLGWLQSLFGPVFNPAARRRRAQLGLDDALCTRGAHAIRDVLATQGPLTRGELPAHLARHGIHVEGQAVIHLIAYTALEGLICEGPGRQREPTYVLRDDWLPRLPALPREEALAELARRYLAAFGPAGPDDLAAWSGLPRADVRAAWQSIEHERVAVEVAGRPAWILSDHAAWLEATPAAPPVVRLLPAFDSYLLGYRDRALALTPRFARRVHPGGGIIRPTLLVDGRVLGTWRTRRARTRLEVTVEPFERLTSDVKEGLQPEVADVGRFLGMEATPKVLETS